jgi:hypothetical protein
MTSNATNKLPLTCTVVLIALVLVTSHALTTPTRRPHHGFTHAARAPTCHGGGAAVRNVDVNVRFNTSQKRIASAADARRGGSGAVFRDRGCRAAQRGTRDTSPFLHYHEPQRHELCLVHAFNMAMGAMYVTPEALAQHCDRFLDNTSAQ